MSASALDVPRGTSGGPGTAMCAFDLGYPDLGGTGSSITLSASGIGNDAAAFAEVGLFFDANSNNTFDPGVDTRFGAAAATWPADDGSLTFTDSCPIASGEMKRFFVVVKLNGSAAYGDTFNARVAAISATGGPYSGIPTAVMPGIHIIAPVLNLLAFLGSAQTVPATDTGPGGTGREVATFTLTNNNLDIANLASITVSAFGSIDDPTAFTMVALYIDSNASGIYDFGDSLYGTPASAFPTDQGSLTFSAPLAIAVSASLRFFVVVRLNGPTLALPGRTFDSRITGLSGVGTEFTGLPGYFMAGLIIDVPRPEMELTRLGPVANGGTDVVAGFVAGTEAYLIYAISNTGGEILNISAPISAPGALVNCTASVFQQPDAFVAPTGQTTLIIMLRPIAPGPFSCTLSIGNDDPDENPYVWMVSGVATNSGSGAKSDDNDSACTTGDTQAYRLLLCAMLAVITNLARRHRVFKH